MRESAIPTNVYWITLPPEELGAAVAERYEKYFDELDKRGRLGLYRLARKRYYGGDHSGKGSSSTVTYGGEQGEASELTINHYGSIVTSLLSMATGSRPAFQAAARDDSAASAAAVQLSDQLIEYELERQAEMEAVDATRRMLLFQEAAIGVYWHPESGAVVHPGGPQMAPDGSIIETPPMHAGELRIEAHSPYDVARDLGARSLRDVPWVIVRRRMNRWDLAALYPEHEGEILAAPNVEADDLKRSTRGATSSSRDHVTDTVYVLELYAAKSKAVPNGRYARVVGSTVIEHGDLQYARIPVGLHSPERTVDEATGSSRTVDLLSPQQAYDGVMSNLLSNNDAFGRGNIVAAKDADVDVEDVGGGLQMVKYTPMDGAREPHAMEMPRLSDADMKFAEMLAQVMQVLSAVNSVVRGDPEESLKSGAALALVQAMAVQHNTGLQRAVHELLRDMAERIVETYRTFATSERLIEVTGTDETRTAKEFIGSDLNAIMSVRVELANPLLRTVAGKKELADFYADPARWGPDALTMHQHMAFMTSGRIQPIWRSHRSEALAIKEECEALARGEARPVLITDHHANHIREHKALLDGKQRMEIPEPALAMLQQHITEHGMQWVMLTTTNPALLMATGQQPAPLPMMAPGMAPPGGAPANDNGAGGPPVANDNAGPPGAAPMPPPAVPPMPGAADQPQGPRMPQMPINPSTGQRANVGNGGVQ